MSPLSLRPYVSFRGRALRSVLAVVVLLGAVLALGASSRPRTPGGVTLCGVNDPGMAEASARFYAAHPPHGGATGAQAVTAVFSVSNWIFDADGDPLTQVDTVRINVGESVQFNWISGLFHNTTSGNAGDLNAGSLWSLPTDALHPTQVVQFNSAGTFPFHCTNHAFLDMLGVVVVKATAGVGPASPLKMGFSSSPSPNPTRGDLAVRFAVAQAGRAQVTAFDAGGRAVATLFDRDVTPGTYSAAWTGRSGAGERLAPGAYFLRLTAPGVRDSRRITIVR
jgi:plastocyanin